MGTKVDARRDHFRHMVDAELGKRGLETASDAEIGDAFRRTTCARQAANFVAALRQPCHVCGKLTRLRYRRIPMCLDCFGRT